MKKQIILAVSIILFGAASALSQTEPQAVMPVKQNSVGVINGKAVTLTKPVYPPAARAVHAEGAVNVQIVIDENGDVVSATAVSGHPLLRQAAVAAAQQSKFHPTLLSGQAVKVTGIVVYNFVADNAASWFKIGYDLASIQHAPSLIFLNTNSIGKPFQADWTTEKEQLQRLAEIKQAEPASVAPPLVLSERKSSENTETKTDGTTIKTVVTQRAVKADGDPGAEQISISQSLIASLQGRLGSDELSSWQFNTGLSLSWALSKLRFTNERQRVLDALRQQIQTAPSQVSPEFLADLQKITTLLEKAPQNQLPEDRGQVVELLRKLSRN